MNWQLPFAVVGFANVRFVFTRKLREVAAKVCARRAAVVFGLIGAFSLPLLVGLAIYAFFSPGIWS